MLPSVNDFAVALVQAHSQIDSGVLSLYTKQVWVWAWPPWLGPH